MNAIEIARVCHEANRAYCLSIGDDSQVAWDVAPIWQRDSAIAGVAFRLDHATALPSAQHDAWCAAKWADGWKHGTVKDATAKTHPCLVPYDQLPEEQRRKDALFQAIVDTRTLTWCNW